MNPTDLEKLNAAISLREADLAELRQQRARMEQSVVGKCWKSKGEGSLAMVVADSTVIYLPNCVHASIEVATKSAQRFTKAYFTEIPRADFLAAYRERMSAIHKAATGEELFGVEAAREAAIAFADASMAYHGTIEGGNALQGTYAQRKAFMDALAVYRTAIAKRLLCPSCGHNVVDSDFDPDQGPFWTCRDCGHSWGRESKVGTAPQPAPEPVKEQYDAAEIVEKFVRLNPGGQVSFTDGFALSSTLYETRKRIAALLRSECSKAHIEGMEDAAILLDGMGRTADARMLRDSIGRGEIRGMVAKARAEGRVKGLEEAVELCENGIKAGKIPCFVSTDARNGWTECATSLRSAISARKD